MRKRPGIFCLSCILICSQAMARADLTTADVMARLKTLDAVASQGTVSLTLDIVGAPLYKQQTMTRDVLTATEVMARLKAFDAVASQGTVSLTLTIDRSSYYKQQMENLRRYNLHVHIKPKEQLIMESRFTPDGRSCTSVKSVGGQPFENQILAIDLSTTITQFGDSEVQVSKTIDRGPSYLDQRKIGSCGLQIGRGLSAVLDPAIQVAGNFVILSGRLADGRKVTATLDPKYDFLPKTVSLAVGKWISEWRYGEPTRSVDGSWIPSEVTTSGIIMHKYSNIRADFRMPSAEQLALPWYVKEKQIVDGRFKIPVLWTYEQLKDASGGKESLTTDELLSLSRRKSGSIGG